MRRCLNCDAIEMRDTSELGHSVVSHEAKEPTCVSIGWGPYDTCTRCEYSTYLEISAFGHQADNDVAENIVGATCTVNGGYDKVTYCAVCREELARKKVSLSVLGHNYSPSITVDREPSCVQNGVQSNHCFRCEERTNVTEIPRLAHSLGEPTVLVFPTCEEGGKEQRAS